MVDILGLVSNLVLPFLEHPVLLFFFILLAVGADASNAVNNVNTPVQLESGQQYTINYRIGWVGVDLDKPFCIGAYPSEPRYSTTHYPSASELQTLCKTREDLGVFGALFSGILNGAGELSNSQELKNAKVSSWMIFVLMIVLTFLVWAVTASTRS